MITVSRPRRHGRRTRPFRGTAFLMTLALAVSGLTTWATTTAHATSHDELLNRPILPGLTVTAIRTSIVDDKPRVTVTVKRDRDLRSVRGVTVGWAYHLERGSQVYDRRDISGPKGKQRYTYKLPTNVHVARIVGSYTFPRASRTMVHCEPVRPGFQMRKMTVSAKQAAAQSVVINVIGGVLTFSPQSRLVRFAGGTVWGWSVFTDVKRAVTTEDEGCPRLRKGHYIVQSTWYSQSGTYTVINPRTSVYRSKAAFDNRRPPLCATRTKVGSYR